MLRTAGPDVYDQWVKHEIPFNDPAVVSRPARSSATSCSPTATCSVARPTRPTSRSVTHRLPMFENPPKCWLHRQASFINSFFPEDAVAGVDYDWFPLPPIDQDGTLLRR